MTKTVLLTFHPTQNLLDRLLSFLDHTAQIAARNGDVGYFGL